MPLDHDFLTSASIARLTSAFRDGQLSPSELVRHCLDRIQTREAELCAWVSLQPVTALKAAAEADRRYRQGQAKSALDGIPFAVKDIIDVADWPTRCGVDFGQFIPQADAKICLRLKQAGAIPLGKTVTTPFACFDPAETRNPRNRVHTPGGSSSGSAATVAAGDVPFALGSQTGGSVIRPAAFCGTFGFKPTFGRIATSGVFPVSPRLDTLGWFARHADDLSVILEAVIPPDSSRASSPLLSGLGETFVVWSEMFTKLTSPDLLACYEAGFNQLQQQGARLESREFPIDWAEAVRHHRVLMAADVAQAHRRLWSSFRNRYPVGLAALIEEGRKLSDREVTEAVEFQDRAAAAFLTACRENEIGLCPSAPGPAPRGLESTGSPIMNSLWTFLGWPCVSVPLAQSSGGMPLGLQLIARPDSDRSLLEVVKQPRWQARLDRIG